MSDLDHLLLPVFARQHWLVSLDDVLEHGGTQRQISRRIADRRWERVDHRVYRLSGMPISWEARVLAPILGTGRTTGVRASHSAAAVLHGIPGYGRGAPELSTRRGYNLRRPGLIIHTSTDLDRDETVLLSGVPTTCFSRTVLDLARTSSDRRVLRAIEWGRRTHRADWSDLISTLARHARRGRPGIRRLRRVIAANAHRTEITDSDFELLLLSLLREHGLPEPRLHHRVYDGERFVAEVDLAYPGPRIAIEADGPSHLEEGVREKDLPRQNDLVLLGWNVLRYTWNRYVTRPERIVAEVRDALRPVQPVSSDDRGGRAPTPTAEWRGRSVA